MGDGIAFLFWIDPEPIQDDQDHWRLCAHEFVLSYRHPMFLRASAPALDGSAANCMSLG
jgi:hypothetical protein